MAQQMYGQVDLAVSDLERSVLQTGKWLTSQDLFFCTSKPLDGHTNLQFGLRATGDIEIETLGFSSIGDSILLEFRVPLESYAGRVDWSWKTQFFRVSKHEDFYAVLRLHVKMGFSLEREQNGELRSRIDFKWAGMTSQECNHWEIDIPFFAGKVVQERLHEFASHIAGDMVNESNHLIPGDPAFLSLYPKGREEAAQLSAPIPLEILAHRAARVHDNRRKVEGLELFGTWVARAEVNPNRGTSGKGIVDFYVTFNRDYTAKCRYEIIRLMGTKLNIEEARQEISNGIMNWLEKHDIVDAHWLLYQDEAPYDYALHVLTNNPAEDRLLKVYALSTKEVIFEILADIDSVVLIRAKRIQE